MIHCMRKNGCRCMLFFSVNKCVYLYGQYITQMNICSWHKGCLTPTRAMKMNEMAYMDNVEEYILCYVVSEFLNIWWLHSVCYLLPLQQAESPMISGNPFQVLLTSVTVFCLLIPFRKAILTNRMYMGASFVAFPNRLNRCQTHLGQFGSNTYVGVRTVHQCHTWWARKCHPCSELLQTI